MLTDIAWHSKKHWGYPAEWMALWKNDLQVSAAMIKEHDCYKAVHEGETVGYVLITRLEEGFEIDHCFISPDYIGKGCGSSLVQFALSQPSYQNAPFQVLSDPNAVAFYQKFGFEIAEHIPSKPEGRSLPLMKMVNS